MITAVEKGRKLVITVGDEDDNIVITVPPVNSKVGMALTALWAGIALGQIGEEDDSPEDVLQKANRDATAMSKMAVGEENWPVIENELRAAESNAVINAAVLWNGNGGGIDLVNEMLRDGLPKAQMSFAEANGFGELLSLLRISLNGVSVNPTPSQDDTPATTTRVGTSGSFGETTAPQSQG